MTWLRAVSLEDFVWSESHARVTERVTIEWDTKRTESGQKHQSRSSKLIVFHYSMFGREDWTLVSHSHSHSLILCLDTLFCGNWSLSCSSCSWSMYLFFIPGSDPTGSRFFNSTVGYNDQIALQAVTEVLHEWEISLVHNSLSQEDVSLFPWHQRHQRKNSFGWLVQWYVFRIRIRRSDVYTHKQQILIQMFRNVI